MDQGFDTKRLKKAAEYIETRLPVVRSMIIIRNGKTVHEKYYWKGGPQEKDYLHSLNGPVLHALIGIAIEIHILEPPVVQIRKAGIDTLGAINGPLHAAEPVAGSSGMPSQGASMRAWRPELACTVSRQ